MKLLKNPSEMAEKEFIWMLFDVINNIISFPRLVFVQMSTNLFNCSKYGQIQEWRNQKVFRLLK